MSSGKNKEAETAGTPGYRMCNRCIMDTTVPGITFDKNGHCNFCKLHDKMERDFPTGEKGQQIIREKAKQIKARSRGGKYDCVVGISGGRDSSFTMHFVKKVMGLNPLAVHFNDGFGNPVAGENMIRVCKKLGVELRTITSDWRESKDLKISFLKASLPDMEEGTDLGIATALYGVAVKENLKDVIIGQSFRTEGIQPLVWNYLDGKYLKVVHKQFGTTPLREWKPEDPGFNLDIREMFYYSVIKRIRTFPVLYYVDYIRKDVDQFLEKELGWVNPGAHYFDDLYQALYTHVLRVKFNINRRISNYSALVRSGQMDRQEAIERSRAPYSLEDPDIIRLCIKRLGLTQEQFDGFILQPPKTFRDYPNRYGLMKMAKPLVWVLSKMSLLPGSAYDKYFNCG